MSVYVFCQALSENSTLFKRLQTNPRVYTLYADLLPLGSGPFCPKEFDPVEITDTLDHLVQTKPDLFASQEVAANTLEELKQEIEKTRTQYPGVETRTCFLDKTYEEIYDRLCMRLTADQEESLLAILPLLFSGDDEAMKPDGIDATGVHLGIVRAATVTQAASVLKALPPEELFDLEAEEWLAEDYGSWRTVYLEAALRDEAIITG